MNTSPTDWKRLDSALRFIKENDKIQFLSMQDMVEMFGAARLQSYGPHDRAPLLLLCDPENVRSNAYEIARWMEISRGGKLGWGVIERKLEGRAAGRRIG